MSSNPEAQGSSAEEYKPNAVILLEDFDKQCQNIYDNVREVIILNGDRPLDDVELYSDEDIEALSYKLKAVLSDLFTADSGLSREESCQAITTVMTNDSAERYGLLFQLLEQRGEIYSANSRYYREMIVNEAIEKTTNDVLAIAAMTDFYMQDVVFDLDKFKDALDFYYEEVDDSK